MAFNSNYDKYEYEDENDAVNVADLGFSEPTSTSANIEALEARTGLTKAAKQANTDNDQQDKINALQAQFDKFLSNQKANLINLNLNDLKALSDQYESIAVEMPTLIENSKNFGAAAANLGNILNKNLAAIDASITEIKSVRNELDKINNGLDSASDLTDKLDFQIQSLEAISANFANSILLRLQDPQTKEKIGIELGSQVDNATKYLVSRFRDNLNNEKIQLGIAEQVVEVLQNESDNLSHEIQQILQTKESSREIVKNLKLSRLAIDKNNLSESLASENERLKKELVATEQLAQKYQNRANQLIMEKDNSFSLSQMLTGIAIAYLVLKPFIDPFISKFL